MFNQIILDIQQIVSRYPLPNFIVTVAAVALLSRVRELSRKKAVVWLLFILYLCFVVELTLLTREPGSRVAVSLRIWETYSPDWHAQCWMVENVLLFIPLGILFPMVWDKMGRGSWLAMASFVLSLSIELTQLATGRGFFQVDDIWLNVLGGMLGFGIWYAVEFFGLFPALCGIAFVMLCGMIFGFSAQTGEESGGLSDAIAQWLSGALEKVFSWQVPAQSLAYPVRKTAHMAEYALLWLDTFAMLASGFHNRGKNVPLYRTVLLGAAIALCVSVSDEIHQLFVPGRAGRLVDVGWDMLGVSLCILVAMGVLRLWRAKVQKP